MRAIVLGSGLSAFSDYFEVFKSKQFESIVGLVYDQLDGHERRFLWCKYNEEPFLIISGKLHFYEGYSFEELIKPIRFAVEELGVDEVIITSASGGLSLSSKVGEWMYVDNVLSIPQVNIEVPAMRDSQLSFEKGRGSYGFQELQRGTYAYHQGPSLGTMAEYKMLNHLGADLVGMSMFPELNYLHSAGIRSHFLSIPVCNYHPFECFQEPTFEEVLEVSASSIPVLVDLIKTYLTQSKAN